MPRDHARILTAIWADDDFRALPADAQRLYMLLLTQDQLTYAGTLDLRVNRWAACAPDTSPDDVRWSLEVLAEHRFVVVDETTEELLVRAYVRINEVWKQPKLMTLALRQAEPVQSRRLRHALRVELLRLPDDKRTQGPKAFAVTLPDTPGDTPPGTPADTPARTLPDTPRHTHAGTHGLTPADTPTRTRGRGRNQEPGTRNQDRGLAVETSGRSVRLADARDRDAPPEDPPIPGHCPAHAHVADPPNCVPCQWAREAREAAELEAAKPPPWPPWCGECDEHTRKVEIQVDGHDAMRNCDHCHPLIHQEAS